MLLIDIEKALISPVPRQVSGGPSEVLMWKSGLVLSFRALKVMNAWRLVRVGDQYSMHFSVPGCRSVSGFCTWSTALHLVLEALLQEFCAAVPWQLFYANDLVVKLKTWKLGIRRKGLCVNMKTKSLVSGTSLDVLKDLNKFLCAMCHCGIGINSNGCS